MTFSWATTHNFSCLKQNIILAFHDVQSLQLKNQNILKNYLPIHLPCRHCKYTKWYEIVKSESSTFLLIKTLQKADEMDKISTRSQKKKKKILDTKIIETPVILTIKSLTPHWYTTEKFKILGYTICTKYSLAYYKTLKLGKKNRRKGCGKQDSWK